MCGGAASSFDVARRSGRSTSLKKSSQNATNLTRSIPVVASYCATFLKPEMLHIYRQITSLRRVRPFVIAQKIENEAQFPFDWIDIVAKPATHFLRRFWFRQVRDKPWQLSRSEVKQLQDFLAASEAE